MSSLGGLATLGSLRKKKNNADLPKRVSTFGGLDMAPRVVVGSKEKNKVQDKIKRRLSQRIGLPANPRQPRPPLPPGALGNLPATRLQVPRGSDTGLEQQTIGRDAEMAVRPVYDPAVFNDPKFDADEYVRRMLQTASATELDDFFQTLQEARATNSTAMQRDTFSNHKEFMTISREVGTLDSDMASIRNMLGELRSVAKSLMVENETAADAYGRTRSDDQQQRRAQRNSIVDFHLLNRNNLKALWQQVEGARKFLPADEGRRVVRESGAWTELNAATWRVKQKVHMVLLNDNLLLAAKRAKPNGSGQRLIAQRCLPLVDIQLTDLRDKEMQDAVMVRVLSTKEKFVFRADRMEEKKTMFLAIQRETAELEASMKRTTMIDLDRGIIGGDPSRQGQIKRLSRRLSKNMKNGALGTSQDGEHIDLAWVQERIDDLDQKIAHRQFAAAVKSLHRGRALVKDASPDDLAGALVALRLDERADHLANKVSGELAQEALTRKSRVVGDLVACLSALDRAQLAHETFFAARTDLIERRLRGIQFEGDVLLYISDVALVHFHLIRQTAMLYSQAFTPESTQRRSGRQSGSPARGSGGTTLNGTATAGAGGGAEGANLIYWSKCEAEKFCNVFHRQLYGVDSGSELYAEALASVARNISILRDIGLDLSFCVQNALTRPYVEDGGRDASSGGVAGLTRRAGQLTISA